MPTKTAQLNGRVSVIRERQSVKIGVEQCFTMLKHEKEKALAQAKLTEVITLEPRWLRPVPASKYSGLSRSTLYSVISVGGIRSYRVGGCRLIDRLELDLFILAHAE